MDPRQFAVLQALAAWRDRLARRLDESWNFIAPDPALWRVALSMPPSTARLRSACNPLPSMMLQHAAEVVDLITRASKDGGDLADPAAAASLGLSVPQASPALTPSPSPA